MTIEEVKKIFRLIRSAYPNSKTLTADTATAWVYVLDPYSYEEVKAAVLDHVRQGNNYPPDVAEVTKRLYKPTPEKPLKPEEDEPGATETDVIDNFRVYAVIVGEPFEANNGAEALVWFRKTREKVRAMP